MVVSANSDTILRLWNFNPTLNGFLLLDETNYHDRCLLKTKVISTVFDQKVAVYVVSACTGGKVCIWDISNEKFVLKNECRPHQSGVKALSVYKEGDYIYIASGGDDNSVSLIKYSLESSDIDFQTEKNAHSSSVSGCFITSKYYYSFSIGYLILI